MAGKRKYSDSQRRQRRSVAVRKIKLACLAAYSDGTMACSQCGYANLDALSLDHVNNDGTPHRKAIGGGYNIYWDLKRRDYPPGFQVLCMNCNWLKEVKRRHDVLYE